MKIVVVSDSHGDYDSLAKIYYSNQDANIFLHIGDFEIPLQELNSLGYLAVKGNCDYIFNSILPLSRDIDFHFGTIHLEHGNLIHYSNFENYVTRTNPKIFLFGHTHAKMALIIKDTYVFNPGSISRPRDCDIGSYLILNIDEKTYEISYVFKDIDNNIIDFKGNKSWV